MLQTQPFEIQMFEGRKLKFAREKVGIKPGRMARELSISAGTYCLLENVDKVFIIPGACLKRAFRIISPDELALIKTLLREGKKNG